MLLESLELEGYRSHAHSVLSLRGLAAAVICGPTGAGKSSLPDALCWLLFDRTLSGRGYARLGADRVRVAAELVVRGERYSLVRTRSFKGKTPKTLLEVRHLSANGGPGTPLTGKSIADTERFIRQLLGVDFDVLVASVISPQGQSDRFTAPPRISIDGKTYEGGAARIQVLAQMLGLGLYETWRRAAVKEGHALEGQAALLEGQLAALAAREQTRPALEGDVAGAEATQAGVRQRRAALDADLEALAAAQAAAQARAAGLEAALAALRPLAEQRRQLQERLDALAAKIERWTQIRAHAPEIRGKAADDGRLAETLAGLRTTLRELAGRVASLAGEETALVTQTAERRTALERERAEIQGRIRAGQARSESTAQAADTIIASCQQQVATLDQVPCKGMEALHTTCPLLAEARRAEGRLASETLRRDAARTWAPDPADAARLDELEGLLAALTQDGAAALRQDRRAAESARASFEQQTTEAESARQALSQWVALLPELELAERELPDLEGQREAAALELRRLEAQLAEGDILAAEAQALTATRQDLGRKSDEGRAARAGLEAEERVAGERLLRARAALLTLDEALAGRPPLEAELAARQAARRLLDLLAAAYKAIPILTLENVAVPCLEEEANKILARVITTGMRVDLRTQRALAIQDASVDALDIVVRDVVGERALEDFSGGQRFLVDLALRLALAKLQGRRAGAPLETLILDEGFGALDGQTLAQVRAMLRVAQEDFPRLLVISHLEGLRDTFGAQVHVSGGPQESVVEVWR